MVKNLTGQLVDIDQSRIYPAELVVDKGKIVSIRPITGSEQAHAHQGPFIMPGLIDAHVHIESSMLVPREFARLAVVHGTVATVSDPHEIANVCGLPGVEFMINNARETPFKFYFGAPSCVPATPFETAGARLDPEAVERMLSKKEIHYLSEMMNFPGVLHGDPEVLQKIAAARRLGKPVDGHAPGLRGASARQYIQAGISTDHECFTREEALEKLSYGMKIIIREGSAAKNFDALIDLLNEYPEDMMFCSDDKHPDSLVNGHINRLCARAVAKDIPLFHVLRAACLNPVIHYGLDVGLLRVGDSADFIVVQDLREFQVLQTFIGGELVSAAGKSLLPARAADRDHATDPINNFHARPKSAADFKIKAETFLRSSDPPGFCTLDVIEALDGQLITNHAQGRARVVDRELQSNPAEDVLKFVAVNRYRPSPVAVAFIRNFGLEYGALASSVAHDSHNIVAIGVDDESIARAVNLIISRKGGVSCVGKQEEILLPLPVGGLMSQEDGYEVASAYTTIDLMAKRLGTKLSAPFMTLSFMALLVIPHLKLSDLGLFDGDTFQFLEPFRISQ
jgi:adenine deaminase